MQPLSRPDTDSLDCTFARVSAEINRAIDRARAADPDLDRAIVEFTRTADVARLQGIFEMRTGIFCVQVLRSVGAEVEALVLAEHQTHFNTENNPDLH